jgi:hypothetical protein
MEDFTVNGKKEPSNCNLTVESVRVYGVKDGNLICIFVALTVRLTLTLTVSYCDAVICFFVLTLTLRSSTSLTVD